MAASERMLKMRDGQFSDYSPMTPRTPLPRAWPGQEPEQEMESISVMPKSADSPAMGSPTTQQYHGLALGQWTVHNQTDTSAALPNRGSQNGFGTIGTPISDSKDPYLHERYL